MRQRALILLITAACAPSLQRRAATIPRNRDVLDVNEARSIEGLTYDPEDIPLRWTGRHEIVLAHKESYRLYDVGGYACVGSGFYIVPLSGGPARALATGHPACDAARTDRPAINSTASVVVFSADTPDNTSGLFALDLQSGRQRSLNSGCSVYLEHPALSPDGRLIAARGICGDRQTAEWMLYVMNGDGSSLRVLAGRPADDPAGWSPDGSQLVYARDSGKLVVVDRQSGRQRLLASGISPAWSPDGKWIAFVSPLSGSRYDLSLQLVHADGAGRRELFRSHERGSFSGGLRPIHEGYPSGPLVWAPSSNALAFSRTFSTGRSIWRLDLASRTVRQVTSPER